MIDVSTHTRYKQNNQCSLPAKIDISTFINEMKLKINIIKLDPYAKFFADLSHVMWSYGSSSRQNRNVVASSYSYIKSL